MNEKQNSNNYYVYLLIDPRDNNIFYVGKGIKKRAEDHLKEKFNENEKYLKIKEIKDSGNNVRIEILSRGLNKEEAFKVETATIDLIGIENLTNINKGHHSKTAGRISYEKYKNNGVTTIKEENWNWLKEKKGLIINIARSYSDKLTAEELYNKTRSAWQLDKKRKEEVKYVLSVYKSVVKEVYEVKGWFKFGETIIDRNLEIKENEKKKSEFVGKIAEENIRKKFIGKSISNKFSYNQLQKCTIYVD